MKLEILNPEKVEQPVRVSMNCQHIAAMRRDAKTHELWLTRLRMEGVGETNVLHCEACALENMTPPPANVEIVWRLPYMIGNEEAIRKIIREPGSGNVVPISDRAKKFVEKEFGKDTKQ